MLLTPLVPAVAFPLRAGALLAVLVVLVGYASKLSRAGRFSS